MRPTTSPGSPSSIPTGDNCIVLMRTTTSSRTYWTGHFWSMSLREACRYSSVESARDIISRQFHRLIPSPVIRSIFEESTRKDTAR